MLECYRGVISIMTIISSTKRREYRGDEGRDEVKGGILDFAISPLTFLEGER